MAQGMSVVIVNYNGGPDLLECIASLQDDDAVGEVVVVDNGSSDGSHDRARERWPMVTVVERATNIGFPAAVRAGVASTSGDHLLVLNPDVRLAPGCASALRAALLGADGVAGPVLDVEASGRAEYGATVNHLGMPRALLRPGTPLYVPGCVLATSRRMYERVGGMDDRYFLFVEDVEFCWRVLLAGGQVQVVEQARAWHRGGGSVPGGYLREGQRYRSSELRVSLRERNTMAAMVCCAPAAFVPVAVVGCGLRSMGTAAAALAMGHRSLGRALLEGLVWNARQVGPTLRRRRSLHPDPGAAAQAWSRLGWGPYLLRVLLRHGLPRIVE